MYEPRVFLQRTITSVLWLVGGYFFFRLLLTPLLPFLLALAVSAVAEPLVQKLRRLLKVRRPFAAVTVITGILLAAAGVAAVLLRRLLAELSDWTASLPQRLSALPDVWNSALDRLSMWYEGSHPFLRSALDLLAGQLTAARFSLPETFGEKLTDTLSRTLEVLPDTSLFCITSILALYFTGISYPDILSFLKRQLPPAWQPRCRLAAQCFRSTILKWLRAEGILLLTTFSIQLVGLTLLRVEYALLAALFISLVDALPVLGSGIILLPWGVLSCMTGTPALGAGLLLLYCATLLLHALLEPRLLAGQVGLPPLTALLAMYVGFHFIGIVGMLLLPLCLLLAKQLQDAGVIRIWK